jgi:DNA primase
MRRCTICHQPWLFAYCGQHREQRQPRPLRPASARVPCAAPATLDVVYCALLAALPLASSHRQALLQRGLADSEIRRRHYGTLPLQGRAALAKKMVDWWGADVCAQVPGFYLAARDGQRWWSLAGAAGLLIPVRDRDGHIVALKVRADDPGDGPKYTTISSARHGGPSPGAQVHIPHHDSLHSETIRLTEGELKADVATVLSGMLTVSVPGVALWRRVLPMLQALQPQRVRLAFDADWRTNPHVAQALGQAAFALVQVGYAVQVEVWDPALGKGVDDLLAAGYPPAVQSVALAFGASVRGQARAWTGQVRTVTAEEVPPWR